MQYFCYAPHLVFGAFLLYLCKWLDYSVSADKPRFICALSFHQQEPTARRHQRTAMLHVDHTTCLVKAETRHADPKQRRTDHRLHVTDLKKHHAKPFHAPRIANFAPSNSTPLAMEAIDKRSPPPQAPPSSASAAHRREVDGAHSASAGDDSNVKGDDSDVDGDDSDVEGDDSDVEGNDSDVEG